MRIAIINYGMGNLGSVRRAFVELGAQPYIADDPQSLSEADRIVLPGVGSFADAMALLRQRAWVEPVRAAVGCGTPLLGICLGMQLLASRGTEGGEQAGLDLIPGEVKKLDALGCTLRVPHVGWSNITLTPLSGSLFDGIPDQTDFYFVHSFAFQAARPPDVLANADYGVSFPAAISAGMVYGTQFHPEKSSKAGFRLLKNFIDLKLC